MALADVSDARDPLGRAGDRALRGVAGADEDLLVDVPLSRASRSALNVVEYRRDFVRQCPPCPSACAHGPNRRSTSGAVG
jgi:hypothetical protein